MESERMVAMRSCVQKIAEDHESILALKKVGDRIGGMVP